MTTAIPDLNKQAFSTSEVARLLGVHVCTVTDMLSNGRLQGRKIGKSQNSRWRIYGWSVRKFLGLERQEEEKAEWQKHSENEVTDSVLPITAHHAATGAALDGAKNDGVTVKTLNLLSSNSTPYSIGDLGVLTVTPSLSSEDKHASEAVSDRVMGEIDSVATVEGVG